VPAVTSAALFYVVSATLAVSGLFLLVELLERLGASGRPRLTDDDFIPGEDTNLDDEELPLVGQLFPVSVALLGLSFMACALLVAGLPPLSGFIAKLALLASVLEAHDALASAGTFVASAPYLLFGLLLLSGFAATLSLARAGIRYFWSPRGRLAPRIKSVEAAAVLTLVTCGALLTVWAEPVVRYTSAAAASLHAPEAYVETVLSAKARPGPARAPVAPEGTP